MTLQQVKSLLALTLANRHLEKGFFPETAVNVDGKVAGLYFAADRYYNSDKPRETLKNSALNFGSLCGK